MSAVTVGQPAPPFALPASTGGTLSLADLRGKNVVLYFYPKDNTPGCTSQACGFRDANTAFAEAETVIVGVSPDPLTSHAKFITKHELPFVLLADVEHQVAEQYGVWKEKSMYGKKFWGIERTTFLIDKEGQIVKVYPKVKVNGHVEQVLTDAQQLT